MDSPSLNVLSLCTGGGGLDLGIRLACRAARAVCYVEIESFACEVLASRMAEGRMDAAPVWTDLRSFDGRPWRGVVDLVAGGFPCTDISNAGKRAGIEGEHSSLWFEFARVVREVGPGLVFVENVPPILVRGLDRVLGDLAGLGFDAEWDLFSAAEVGAPHLRERFFLLARHVSDTGRDLLRLVTERDQREGRRERAAERGDAEPGDVGEEVADAVRCGRAEVGVVLPRRLESDASGEGRDVADAYGGREPRERPSRRRSPRRVAPRGGREALADTDGSRSDGLHEREQLRHVEAVAQGGRAGPASEAPLWPPGPDDEEGWREFLERVPGAQPALRRGAHGMADRVDRLRLLGNGVVPQVAALALRTLARRLIR